jgi:hypothetical protein
MELSRYYQESIENSLKKASVHDSNLTNEIFDLEGFSGKMTRCFYNNLCSMKDTRYLEIGCWKGSTLCSAMYENPHGTFVGIDNFSEFNNGAAKEELIRNINKYEHGNVTFIENDCFRVNTDALVSKFNILMYDGNHTYEAHYEVLKYYLDVLDDIFIYIVDDYNWSFVRTATRDSITETKCEILYDYEKRTSSDDEYPTDQNMMKDTFWNGMYVAVLRKSFV